METQMDTGLGRHVFDGREMVVPAGLSEVQRFFWDQAGWSWVPGKQTPAEGREECARALAAAEQWFQRMVDGGQAEERWGEDWHGTVENCFPCLTCWIRVGDRVASLSGIEDGPDGEYRRVVRAELALELMDRVTEVRR